MHRLILPTTLVALALAWTGRAHAEEPRTGDDPKDPTEEKKADKGNNAEDTSEGVGEASQAAADDVTSTVGTTAANVFQLEKPKEDRGSMVMLGTSLTVLGLAYIPSAIVGIASPKDTDAWMAMPVAGPWIALGAGSDERQWTGDVAIAASGVIQGAAAVGALMGALAPDGTFSVTTGKVVVQPVNLGRAGYGLGAAGTF